MWISHIINKNVDVRKNLNINTQLVILVLKNWKNNFGIKI
jgi:hypothetical protein